MRFIALILALASSAFAAPPAKRDVVVFVGDSLTAGYGLSPEEAYPALIQRRWEEQGLPWKVRNAGVSGATTADALHNLDWTLTDDVRLVFVAIGANDGLRGLPVAAAKKNIAAILEAARRRGAKVALAGMRVPSNYGPAYTQAFQAMYPALAKAHRVKLLPFLLEGIALDPKYTIEDGMHPNAAGQRLIAERVLAFLKKEGLP